MNSFTLHEAKQHGTPEFPFEYHYINYAHPRYEMPFHWHKEWEIIHIIEGKFEAHCNDNIYKANPGDVILIRDGMLHGGMPDNCIYECFVFDLHGLFRSIDLVKKHLRPFYRGQLIPETYFPLGKLPELTNIITMLSKAYQNAECSPLELVVISSISHLFSIILQHNVYSTSNKETTEEMPKIDLIKNVLEYIELHYASSLSLDDLAAVANMNPRYFCRFFRSITHQTPIDYVNRCRIEKAAYLLQSTRLPVTDIGLECGFNDSSNFIKSFKKYKNLTPLQYRKEQ